jgi:hypothetical protein
MALVKENNFLHNIKYYNFLKKKEKEFLGVIKPARYLGINELIYIDMLEDKNVFKIMCTNFDAIKCLLFSKEYFGEHIEGNLQKCSLGRVHMSFNHNDHNDRWINIFKKDKQALAFISIFLRTKNKKEVFIFLQDGKAEFSLNKSISNVKYLKKFISYFRERAQNLFCQNKKEIVFFLDNKTSPIYSNKSQAGKDIILNIPYKGFNFGKESYVDITLSYKESVYLYFLSLSKTNHAISVLMNISPKRGFDLYKGIKNKTNLNTKHKIIELFNNR